MPIKFIIEGDSPSYNIREECDDVTEAMMKYNRIQHKLVKDAVDSKSCCHVKVMLVVENFQYEWKPTN